MVFVSFPVHSSTIAKTSVFCPVYLIWLSVTLGHLLILICTVLWRKCQFNLHFTPFVAEYLPWNGSKWSGFIWNGCSLLLICHFNPFQITSPHFNPFRAISVHFTQNIPFCSISPSKWDYIIWGRLKWILLICTVSLILPCHPFHYLSHPPWGYWGLYSKGCLFASMVYLTNQLLDLFKPIYFLHPWFISDFLVIFVHLIHCLFWSFSCFGCFWLYVLLWVGDWRFWSNLNANFNVDFNAKYNAKSNVHAMLHPSLGVQLYSRNIPETLSSTELLFMACHKNLAN